jgi:HD-GYP domain-containing protein (c-di-GMP phosphodiesterase class II)
VTGRERSVDVLAVEVQEAEPGMKLAVAVMHPEKPSHELLRPGFMLTDESLCQLRALSIGVLYVDYPGLEDLDKHFAVHLSPARQGAYQQIKRTIAQVQRNERPVAGFSSYYETTRDLITTLLDTGRQPCHIEMLCGNLGKDAVAHATTVAQLALTLGLRLEQYVIEQRSRLPASQAKQVVNLGVAGMLHDIGKAKLPPELQDCSDIAPPQDKSKREQWESHVRIGYELIHDDVEATAASAVLHHHQHFDGSGFPRGTEETAAPAGDKIHVFSRILLAADLYDRIAAGVPGDGRRRRPGVEVLHVMRTRHANWLDPEILKMFAAVVPPYPPGARVRLSDGTDAVVIAPNPSDPYRPPVRRIEGDERTLSEPVPLAKPGAPSIVAIGDAPVEQIAPVLPAAA